MADNKSPAFQFYAENFLNGTAEMSAEEVGAYIRLLCHQWHLGSLPDDDKKLMRLTGGKKAAIELVKKKFVKGDDGNLRNARLEVSRQQQQEYRERQNRNGRLGGRPKKETQPITQTKPTDNPVVSSGLSETEPKDNLCTLQSSSASSTENTNPPAVSKTKFDLAYFEGIGCEWQIEEPLRAALDRYLYYRAGEPWKDPIKSPQAIEAILRQLGTVAKTPQEAAAMIDNTMTKQAKNIICELPRQGYKPKEEPEVKRKTNYLN